MRYSYFHEYINSVKQNFLKDYPQEVAFRYNKLKVWKQLKSKRCSRKTIQEALGVSSATLYRWKKRYQNAELDGLKSINKKPYKIRKPIKQKKFILAVLALRKKYPIFGKEKIKIMLEKEYGIIASVSTVRIVIKTLITQGKIQYVNDVCGKRLRIKRRQFNGYAERFVYSMKAQELGQMIQVDHMTQGPYKHFAAICPLSKLTFTYAYRQATAFTAADFLQKMTLFFPFKLSSIQVDGGSEFMAEFEENCQKLALKLFVLPPRSPKLNGCVERSNGTFSYEFYVFYPHFKDLADLNQKLSQF